MKNFKTVASMKLATLTAGQTVETQGYTTAGDGGGATYLIVTTQAADGFGDHTLANGNVAVLQVNHAYTGVLAASFGILGDGADNSSALAAATTYADSKGMPLVLPAGDVGLTETYTITRAGNDFTGFTLIGQGRSATTFKRVSGAITDMIEIVCSGGFTLNNHFKGFGIDLVDTVDTGINGIKLNAGVWRSKFEDLYLLRPNTDKTGIGIYGGSATPADKGFYDNKFDRLYIGNFDRNVYLQGTDLSGNTVTNTTISDSYIAGAATANLQIDFFNGVLVSGSQLEAHEADGALLNGGDTAVFMGGSIESPEAGAVGINMDANTKSVVAYLDFFNNAGGNFLGNNKAGHMYKTNGSAFVLPAGAVATIDSDGTNFSRLRFFEDGVADVSLRVSDGGDGAAFANSAGTEKIKMDMGNNAIVMSDGGSTIVVSAGLSVTRKVGQGTPEGVVTAPKGSTFQRTDGGAGTSFYVKESGAGNTGWVGK